jgi:hypothetical protein
MMMAFAHGMQVLGVVQGSSPVEVESPAWRRPGRGACVVRDAQIPWLNRSTAHVPYVHQCMPSLGIELATVAKAPLLHSAHFTRAWAQVSDSTGQSQGL